MKTAEKVLDILEKNKGRYVSGARISDFFGLSRNSVWKAVHTLQKKGYNISAVTNKGYILHENNRIISAGSVSEFVEAENIKIIKYETVDSTNTVLKKMAEAGESEGTVVMAGEQTAGRGRLGRSFSSQRDTGVYFSILLRPQLKPQDSLLITTCAAAAVARSIEKNTGRPAAIKWVNDIYIDDRKVAGILTEGAFDLERGTLSYAVLGIGINMYFDDASLPEEIKDIAGAVFEEMPDSESISRIIADVLNFFMADYKTLTEKHFYKDYVSRSYLDGKKISVIKPDCTREATALGTDEEFRLHVRYEDGTEEFLSTGEVSTKPVFD